MNQLHDQFNILGISSEASYDEAKVAYRELASILHPDKHMHNERIMARATEKFQQLKNAWDDVEVYFKKLEAYKLDQALYETREREKFEREQREREEVARAEARRKAEEDAKYVKHACPHCGYANKMLIDTSFEAVRCLKCQRYLSANRDRDEQARAAKLEREEVKRQCEEIARINTLNNSTAQIKKKSVLTNMFVALGIEAFIYILILKAAGGLGAFLLMFIVPPITVITVICNVGFFGPSWKN